MVSVAYRCCYMYISRKFDIYTIFNFCFSYLDWTEKEEDLDDINVWEDNWDDDNVEDDFSQQLR